MEYSIFWDNTTNPVGDGAAKYTESQLFTFFRQLLLNNPAEEGVAAGIGSELIVQATGSSREISIGAGMAAVYGCPYFNTAQALIVLPQAISGTTGHRLVLRMTWATKRVRLTVISSGDGNSNIPAIGAQNPGTSWDISLAGMTVTTGGLVTVSQDYRRFFHLATKVASANIDLLAVLTEHINNKAVQYAKIQDMAAVSLLGRSVNSSGVPGAIAAGADNQVLRRRSSSLSFGAIGAAEIENRTRQFFVAPTGGDNALSELGYFLADNVWTTYFGRFCVPNDFASGLTAKPLLYVPGTGSGNMDIQQWATYGASGETYGIHENTGHATHACTKGQYVTGPSISLASAAIGDFVALKFVRRGDQAGDTINASAYLLGYLIEYTADM